MTPLLLNIAHAIDHPMLPSLATARDAIATGFVFERRADPMPYAAGAFLMSGIGSLPSGRPATCGAGARRCRPSSSASGPSSPTALATYETPPR